MKIQFILMMFLAHLVFGCSNASTNNSTNANPSTNSQQSTARQPSISLAQTAEANQNTENMRSPQASETEKSQTSESTQATQPQLPPTPSTTTGSSPMSLPAATTTASITSAAPTSAVSASAAPTGAIKKTDDKPTVTERARTILKAPEGSTIKGESILEETAKGTWVHLKITGLNPQSKYNLSLYEKKACDDLATNQMPQTQPRKVLAKLNRNNKGNANFNQFFRGLKINGENGIRQQAMFITENDRTSSAPTAACAVLNN